VSALFEVVDPTRGAVRCRECGAVDMVTTDTWTEDGQTVGHVICGGCGGVGDLHTFPYDWQEV
jgi:hypothetical protein